MSIHEAPPQARFAALALAVASDIYYWNGGDLAIWPDGVEVLRSRAPRYHIDPDRCGEILGVAMLVWALTEAIRGGRADRSPSPARMAIVIDDVVRSLPGAWS
jgi:hypothetical protein